MLYIDTSIIVKLYFKEKFSPEASDWVKKNNEAIPLTGFHELEITNAIHLKEFRSEITSEQVRHVLSKFYAHQKSGVYYRPMLNWADTINFAVDIARNHTRIIGSRSLDILHIASALAIKADRFLTFDKRQQALADATGLKIESCTE